MVFIMTYQLKHTIAAVLMSAAAAGIAGCGRGDNPRPAQAVAKVDGYEVTVHEINEILSRLPAQPSTGAVPLQARALDAVIDRRLLVAKALESKLERNPDVMQAMAAARDEVLAKAYLQNILARTSEGDPAGVKAYYEKNPHLFADRKLYEMRQVTIAEQDASDELGKVIDTSHSVDQVADWLQARSIRFEKAATNRSTADLPSKIVENLDKLTSRNLFVIKQPGRIAVASLSYIKDTPVSLTEASGDIQRYLANQHADAAVHAELKRLRASADIQYLSASDSPGTHLARGAAGLR
jgi:EpsD family peptidyl-prolyl cis-trans isomerase